MTTKIAVPTLYATVIVAALLLLQSCTTHESYVLPDGTVYMRTSTPPLIGRKETPLIRHEWIGEDNVLHEVVMSNDVEIRPDAQVEALRIVRDLAVDTGKGVR